MDSAKEAEITGLQILRVPFHPLPAIELRDIIGSAMRMIEA